MKSSVFLGNGKFEVRDVVLPEPGPGEVTVRVAACGVCGTDVHIYHGDKGSADVTPPVILGHEIAGVVEKLGPGVTGLAVGEHVAVDPNIYCGRCRGCRSGKKHMCENLFAIGVNRDGGFAEACVVPQTQCIPLSPEVPLRYGAMAEPLACCLHGIDLAGIRPGQDVCVIGGGAIGLMLLQLAKLSGAAKVALSEPDGVKRETALRLGADGAIDPIHEDLNGRLEAIFGAPGADVVIECAGVLSATEQAFSAARRGATVVLFSVPRPEAKYPLSLEDVYKKELTIRGSFINPDTQARAVALINAGRIDLDPIITHSFPVEKLEEAILTQMSPGSIKVIIEP